MDNAIITIPDDNCEVITTPPLKNDNNAAITIPDNECVIVQPPDESTNISKPTSNPIKVSGSKHDFESLQPIFGWLPIDTIKKTFQLTT